MQPLFEPENDGKPWDDTGQGLLAHSFYMRQALAEANAAYAAGEVPVGAVVVAQGRIVARAHNLVQTLNDVTAHAEMQALTAAANHYGTKYLAGCTLYVTLEPCPMCAGALFWGQLGRVVFGAADVKRGYSLFSPRLLHPRTDLVTGVMAEECGELLTRFFKERRGV